MSFDNNFRYRLFDDFRFWKRLAFSRCMNRHSTARWRTVNHPSRSSYNLYLAARVRLTELAWAATDRKWSDDLSPCGDASTHLTTHYRYADSDRAIQSLYYHNLWLSIQWCCYRLCWVRWWGGDFIYITANWRSHRDVTRWIYYIIIEFYFECILTLSAAI